MYLPLVQLHLTSMHCCCRFSAKYRQYKYFFLQDGTLNLQAMETAAQYLVGDHDFRNFCKADVGQVKTFGRTILSASFEPAGTSCNGVTTYALNVKGTAFLWHQVNPHRSLSF